jgi:hypothetical protein
MSKMITHDGVDWPVATFISAYGFVEINPWDELAPIRESYEKIIAITSDGELIEGEIARNLDWSEVVAIRRANGATGLEICDSCGDLAELTHVGDGSWCDDCLDDEDYY